MYYFKFFKYYGLHYFNFGFCGTVCRNLVD